MMSYAQDSRVGATSTSVPECRKETPDRLAGHKYDEGGMGGGEGLTRVVVGEGGA